MRTLGQRWDPAVTSNKLELVWNSLGIERSEVSTGVNSAAKSAFYGAIVHHHRRTLNKFCFHIYELGCVLSLKLLFVNIFINSKTFSVKNFNTALKIYQPGKRKNALP